MAVIMTIPMSLKIDGECLTRALQSAEEQLDRAEGKLALDFSSVRRIDPNALAALAKFAGSADDKATKVTLHGVSVDVYKVLKLSRLTSRFSFVSDDAHLAAPSKES